MQDMKQMIFNIIQENSEPEQLTAALNSFLNAEVFIDEHINQLYQTLAHGRGIRELVEIADRFLKHPISVCDTSYNIIEASNSMRKIPYGMDSNQLKIESMRQNRLFSPAQQITQTTTGSSAPSVSRT